MQSSPADEHAWLVMDEKRWVRARAIAATHRDLDASDIYHTLVNFERTPDERLALGLRHAKLAVPPRDEH